MTNIDTLHGLRNEETDKVTIFYTPPLTWWQRLVRWVKKQLSRLFIFALGFIIGFLYSMILF